MSTLVHNELSNIIKINPIDTSRCRGCFEEAGLIDTFKVHIDNFLLWEIIKYCTNEQISHDDELPSKLCNSCFEKFRSTYFFIKEFRETQKKFINLMETPLHDSDTKIDIDEDFKSLVNFETEIPLIKDETDKIDKEFNGFPTSESLEKNPETDMIGGDDVNTKMNDGLVIKKKNADMSENTKLDEVVVKVEMLDMSENSKVNDAENDDIVKEKILIKCRNINEILESHIESHNNSGMNGTSNYEATVSPNIPEVAIEKFPPVKLKKSRKEPNTQCFECLTVFLTGADLKRHSKATGHVIAPRYQCEHCGKNFKFRHIYKTHLRSHGAALEDSVCEICGACVRTSSLPRHMERHGSGNTCPDCGKNFTQKAYLQMHIRKTHQLTENLKKELCHICGVQRNNLNGLNQHMNKKHGESTNWSFQCETCSMSFFTKFSLSLHVQKMHMNNSVCKTPSRKTKIIVESDITGMEDEEESSGQQKDEGKKMKKRPKDGKEYGKKIVQCPICSKQITAAALYQHKRTHKESKPYECKVCTKTFKLCHQLKSHMNIHLDLKPYECKHCKKCFRHQTTLRIHTRSHTGETPYVCRFCQKGFAHSSSMKKHEETHTKKELKVKETA